MAQAFCALFAVLGFYAATLRLLRRYIKISFDLNIYDGVFLSFVAWALSRGLRAIILVWGYSTNTSLSAIYFLNGVVGVLLLAFGWPVLTEYKKAFCFLRPGKFDAGEKALAACILFLLILYLYRVTLPWSDMDETILYGYTTKLIAAGRTLADMIGENVATGFVRSQLVQCWDAQIFALVNDTWLVRLERLINLLFCAAGIFAFLRLAGVRRFWSLSAVAVFLATPELSYLALSLKVDAVVMMFELAAFLSLVRAVIIVDNGPRVPQNLKGAFILSLSALLLSAFAFGSRFTGIISMVLSSGFSWYFLTKLIRRPLVSLGVTLALFVVFMFFSSPGYWVNWLVYHNPIYPTKPFWPLLSGGYTCTMEHWKSWNIVGLPPVILQFYLIFALGTGIELLDKIMPFLNHLPMAAYRTQSMGWPYPLLLCVFLWPFFTRGNRTLNFIVGIFIFQLTGWSLGFHYSRLLAAACTLMILAGAMMADLSLPPQDILRTRIRKILRIWMMVSLGLCLLLQIWWFNKRFYGPFLFTAQSRYQAAAGYLKDKKDNGEINVPTFEEARVLESFFLAKEAHPVVYTFSYSSALQVLFDGHILVENFDSENPYSGGGHYLLLNPAVLKKKLIDKKIILRDFPVQVLVTPVSKWEVYAVSRK